MPVVKADNRLLYDGPSVEDARLVAELAKEFGIYERVLVFSLETGSPVPRGLCGKELLMMEKDKERLIRETLSQYKEKLRVVARSSEWTWRDEPSAIPPKYVVRNLLANSVAKDFDEARREWQYEGEVIEEGEDGFAYECALCGPKEQMRYNFVIRNTKTGRKLQVGSVCVKRFLVLAGTSSVEESAAVFDRRTALAVFGRSLERQIADLALEPVPERSLIAVMAALERSFPNGITEDEIGIIVRAAEVDGTTAAQVLRAIVLKDAAFLRTLSVRKMKDREEKRRRIGRVLSTLSRSEAYRVSV